ncbi:unnamed protein product [Thelazia callipaeda]|uniref:Uncharacterized protein n=1 Tax=Thelazia callipaeda TaxID=103827 RepID=A0A0N5CV52_THECL|nr:unnamed protein product [Thelazia callipaeda]
MLLNIITTICLFLIFTIHLIVGINSLAVPAGLRPAKKVGDPKTQILPLNYQKAQQQSETLNLLQPTPKVPPNLSLRSRMMAALSASSAESNNTGNNFKAKADKSSKPPIIFSKNQKKVSSGKTTPHSSPKENARVVVAPPANLGKNNYGLNTVLQTNLVDSHGRVIKNVNTVPIKVPSSAEMKHAKTRHTARQVESDADKVVPIKFGSSSQR